jgi:sugar phosphate isomerase/epimerase
MIVALNSASNKFFETDPPYGNDELLRFVRKTSSLGFRAVQIGPLTNFVSIEGERLRTVLDSLDIERNVHAGGLYDAERLALTHEEGARVQNDMHCGIVLCRKISSTLVSIHPPFLAAGNMLGEGLRSEAKKRFLELLLDETDFASRNGVEMALESFCCRPFIFEGLSDFARFVSNFPSEKLGVLLDIGHLYHVGIELSEAVHLFEDRLLDVHIHDATLEKDYRKATHLPIGKGAINFPWFIDLLRDVRYDGWLTLEIRGSEEEILNAKKYLENLLRNEI